jgi:acyl-CoA reductase-like NAD-dependent aldehyde dehydrogenase
MRDEIFGPILPIITVKSALDDGIHLINKGPNPLTSYIFTRDNNKAERLIQETQSGSVLVNDVLMHYGLFFWVF